MIRFINGRMYKHDRSRWGDSRVNDTWTNIISISETDVIGEGRWEKLVSFELPVEVGPYDYINTEYFCEINEWLIGYWTINQIISIPQIGAKLVSPGSFWLHGLKSSDQLIFGFNNDQDAVRFKLTYPPS